MILYVIFIVLVKYSYLNLKYISSHLIYLQFLNTLQFIQQKKQLFQQQQPTPPLTLV